MGKENAMDKINDVVQDYGPTEYRFSILVPEENQKKMEASVQEDRKKVQKCILEELHKGRLYAWTILYSLPKAQKNGWKRQNGVKR